MGFDVHVLGTASARPTSRRAVSGNLVKCRDGVVVIDAGEGFQSRYMAQRRHLKEFEKGTTVKTNHVSVLAFTHGHLDHTWGALPWMQTMGLDHRQTPLLVLGPTSSNVMDALLKKQSIPTETPPADLARQWQAWHRLGASGEGLSYPIRWVLGDVSQGRWAEMDPQTGHLTLLEGMPQPEGWKSCSLQALDTQHSVPSCAWEVKQSGLTGTFNRLRAAELRLNKEEQRELATGNDIVHNGQTLSANSFRSEAGLALRVVLSGDTAEGWASSIEPGANLLIHEATFLNEQQDKANEHLHSTAAGAVRTAQQMKASHLAITHFSSRLKSHEASLSEANDTGALPIAAVSDGDRFLVNDDGTVHHLVKHDSGWTSRNMEPNR
ncbi:MAG: hypothetical protein L7S56_02715 [Candidatus Poseidonia sp.]|nr:hypothetical protein [Poseidonia sp.]